MKIKLNPIVTRKYLKVITTNRRTKGTDIMDYGQSEQFWSFLELLLMRLKRSEPVSDNAG